ncbi:DUF2520 domain-containing protein [Thiotrichales bacterium 19S9-12]|nr:DUF2520 domain-containing protein [Thiotrichales bacterium 19S9-11]MCF6812280.1 DUF2520 domain-containing protein [Thiotrichales bacterium 19S9-12]
MAKHFSYYLDMLNIKYNSWNRSQPISQLTSYLQQHKRILFLIKDDVIDPFIEQYALKLKPEDQYYIHFSGALISNYAYTAHPLQTFSNAFYSIEQYINIPFAIESKGPCFEELLPGLTNKHFKINKEDKYYYHALTSMANNFTTLLWQKYFNALKKHFNLDPSIALPIFEQTMTNIKEDFQNALTGPIARKDIKTINNHFEALAHDNFLSIYQAFVNTHLTDVTEDKNEHNPTYKEKAVI